MGRILPDRLNAGISSGRYGPLSIGSGGGVPIPDSAPVNTGISVSGTYQVGSTATVAATWTGKPIPTVSYRLQFRQVGGAWNSGLSPTAWQSSPEFTFTPDMAGLEFRAQSQAINSMAPGGVIASTAPAGPIAAAPVAFARTALTAPSRSVHNGHSLTDAYVHSGAWPKDIRLIAKSVMPTFNDDGDGLGGIVKSTIPGSSLRYRWNNPTTPKDARLNVAEYNTLMITEGGPPPRPHYTPHNDQMKESLEYLLRFAQNQYDNGAGQEVIVWSIWPYLDGNQSLPEAPHWSEFGGFRGALPEYGRSYKYMSDYVTWKMHQLYPAMPADWRVWQFPGHLWMARVYDDVQAGQVPGVTTFASLFNDDIHPSDITGYGLACFVFTMLYQVDMRTVPGVYVPPSYPAALASYYQSIAWEIATSYEPVGMGGTDGAALVFDPAVDPDPLEEAPVDPGSLPAGHRILIEADKVEGATFTPALPAAVNGARHFDGTAQYVAPYATTGVYAAMALRTASVGGVVDVLRFTNQPASQWSNGSLVLARNNFILSGALQAVRYNPEEPVSGKVASAGDWLVVEMMAVGNLLAIYCDGEETFTTAAPMGATAQLAMFPQIAGDLLSFVTYNAIPTAEQRTGIRNYMQAKIEGASASPLAAQADIAARHGLVIA